MTDEIGVKTLARAAVGARVSLPPPRSRGEVSVEEAISRRRSVRDFQSAPLSLAEISQLVWSAQGVTSPDGKRAAPSAGACYPLETYLVCAQGLFRYRIGDHALVKVNEADLRGALCEACHGQEFVAKAPVSLVFAAVYRRTTKRYGERGERYVHIDVGHAAQNVHLEAVALGLGSVPVGAFDDQAVARALGLPGSHAPLYIVTVGHPT